MSIFLSRQHLLCFKLQCPETGSYCSHKWTRLKCFLTTSDRVLYSWNVIWKKHMKIEKYIQRIDRKYINCIWMKKGKTWFFSPKTFWKGLQVTLSKSFVCFATSQEKSIFLCSTNHESNPSFLSSPFPRVRQLHIRHLLPSISSSHVQTL